MRSPRGARTEQECRAECTQHLYYPFHHLLDSNVTDHRAGADGVREADIAFVAGSGASACWADSHGVLSLIFSRCAISVPQEGQLVGIDAIVRLMQ